MAATLLGTLGVFGLTAQTGMILQTQDDDFTTERKILVNEAGEKSGIALYGDQRVTTIAGLIPSTSSFSTRMAAAVTLANTPTDFYRSAPASGFGDVILTGAKQSKKNEDFHSFSFDLWSTPFFDTGS